LSRRLSSEGPRWTTGLGQLLAGEYGGFMCGKTRLFDLERGGRGLMVVS
jgi:hypothetical protein